MSHQGGFSVQTNKKSFIIDFNPRTLAKWESVFEELEYNNLLKPVGHQGFIYQLTKKGYELADRLISLNK